MSDPEAIRADIEQQREALAETVDALHDKLDVRSRVSRTQVVGAAVGAVALVGLLVWWKRR